MSKDETMTGFRNKEDLNQATRFLHENGIIHAYMIFNAFLNSTINFNAFI